MPFPSLRRRHFAAALAGVAFGACSPPPVAAQNRDPANHPAIAEAVAGLPADSFVRVVREDPKRRVLLFAGTETGVHVSFDAGFSWRPLQRNLPAVPVTDLVVKGDDVVLATQGRSFWVLDDIAPLRQLTPEVARGPAHLFEPSVAYRFGGSEGRGAVGKS